MGGGDHDDDDDDALSPTQTNPTPFPPTCMYMLTVIRLDYLRERPVYHHQDDENEYQGLICVKPWGRGGG